MQFEDILNKENLDLYNYINGYFFQLRLTKSNTTKIQCSVEKEEIYSFIDAEYNNKNELISFSFRSNKGMIKGSGEIFTNSVYLYNVIKLDIDSEIISIFEKLS